MTDVEQVFDQMIHCPSVYYYFYIIYLAVY